MESPSRSRSSAARPAMCPEPNAAGPPGSNSQVLYSRRGHPLARNHPELPRGDRCAARRRSASQGGAPRLQRFRKGHHPPGCRMVPRAGRPKRPDRRTQCPLEFDFDLLEEAIKRFEERNGGRAPTAKKPPATSSAYPACRWPDWPPAPEKATPSRDTKTWSIGNPGGFRRLRLRSGAAAWGRAHVVSRVVLLPASARQPAWPTRAAGSKGSPTRGRQAWPPAKAIRKAIANEEAGLPPDSES